MMDFSADRVRLFALSESAELGAAIAGHLGMALTPVEERSFDGGEHKTRSLESVRQHDVCIIQSLAGDDRYSANDKLCRLLFFVASLRDADAAGITVLLPYLAYARKDRKTQPQDPVTSRYVAQLLEAVGCHRVIGLDVHDMAAFQNAFRCRTVHLSARGLLVRQVSSTLPDRALCVVSPDAGGVKRAEAFRKALSGVTGREVGRGFVEKYRSGGELSGHTLVGDVAEKTVLLLDDLISSGRTLARAAQACRDAGAGEIHALATHGVFTPGAGGILAGSTIDRLIICNSVPVRSEVERLGNRLHVVDTAAFLAEALRRIRAGESIADFH